MMKYRGERGQALIMLAISLVVLLGFTALAIDGSLIYSDRRQWQNSVDATSLAGAGSAGKYLIDHDIKAGNWSCNSSVWSSVKKAAEDTAISLMKDKYDLTINAVNSKDSNTENYVYVQCYTDYLDVEVSVTVDTHTSLVHFVYQGEVKNKVIAVTRIYISAPVGAGGSLISLTDSCDQKQGIRFSGGGKEEEDDEGEYIADVYLLGGGAYSNSCVWAEGRVHVHAENGEILYIDEAIILDNATVEPEPQQTNEKNDIVIPPPQCTTAQYVSAPGSGTIGPGNYTGIKTTGSGLTLNPGLYCLTGNFEITGGEVIGDGVTIYLKSGSYSVSGNPVIKLSAPEVGCEATDPTIDGCPPAVGGLLMYLDPTNGSNVEIEGSTGSRYSGTVYAPAPGSIIKIGGTTSTESLEAGVQAIGYTIHVHGNGTLNLIYDEGLFYHTPTKLDLFR
jgi:Flp pilus assembly protein TadG